MAIPCRVMVDEPASGAWNMSLDEALLESVAQASCQEATLRFYQWNEPTLSLGYFQSHSDRAAHKASSESCLVRRSSGGGALIHHHELTYSLALPACYPMSQDAVALTCLAHRALRDGLLELGWKADCLTLCEPVPKPFAINQTTLTEPFLCFERRAKGDLLARQMATTAENRSKVDHPKNVAWHKICGSAQRKRRGAVLQHGGILLTQSSAAPELLGINNLYNVRVSAEAIRPIWQRNLLRSLDLEEFLGNPNDEELAKAQQLEATRFTCSEWTERR